MTFHQTRALALFCLTMLLCGCPNPSARKVAETSSVKQLSNEWFYAHWKDISMDQYPSLSKQEVDRLMIHDDVLLTDEFVPEDWANSDEMLQFFFNEKKKLYWSHKWAVKNADESRRIYGPIQFPEQHTDR